MEVVLMDDYRWVIVALLAHVVVIQWMGVQVGRARMKYKVPYPVMYAVEGENKDANKFNCVQRGHQNSLEFMPTFVVILLLGGLQYPRAAAVLGGMNSVARIQYFRGYSTGSPAARFSGGGNLHGYCLAGLLLFSFAFAIHQFVPTLV